MDYKKGLIHTLLFRAYKTYADYVIYVPKLNFYNQFGKETLVHFSLLATALKKFLDNLFIKRNIFGTVSKKKEVFICLEFLGKMSLQSKKQLIEIFRTCQKKYNNECCIQII